MLELARNRYSWFISLGLAAAAAVVVGIILVFAAKAEKVELTTAELVPDDVGFYFAINTNLASSEWVRAFNLIVRLGQADPEGELRRSVEEDGEVIWDDDIAPFLGGNAAFFLRSVDVTNFDVSGAFLVLTTDPRTALDVIMEESGLTTTTKEHLGVAYYVDDSAAFYAAILGDHVVVGLGEESIIDVIEVFKGERKSLAETVEFRELQDELTRSFLGFMYINSEVFLENLSDDALQTALDEAGVDLALQPFAAVINATEDAFTFEMASVSDPGTIAPGLEPRTSRFASMVPADTSIFLSTSGLAGAAREAIDMAEEDINEAIREGGLGFNSLDELLEEAGAEFGITSLEDILNLYEGETAVAIWFANGNSDDAEGLILSEVGDPEAGREVIESLISASQTPEVLMVGDIEVLAITTDDGERIGFAFDGSDLLIGTLSAVTRTLEGNGPVLAESQLYKDAVKQHPARLGSYIYLDLQALISLGNSGLPSELDDAQRALNSLIFNMVDQGGVTIISGSLSIE